MKYMINRLTSICVLISMLVLCLPICAQAAYDVGYEIIVDDKSSEGFTNTGGWSSESYGDAYGEKAHIINAVAGNSAKAKWTPSIPVDGYYKVYMTWPDIQGTAPSAAVQVHYGENSDYNAKKINQANNAGYWVEIGTFYMKAGNTNYVALKPDTDGYAVADAVKFVLSQDLTGIDTSVISDIESPIDYNQNETVIIQNRNTGEFSLSVNGEPYYVKGVCKSEGMDYIKEAGGNTIRTYSSVISGGATQAILDQASEIGMKVMLGLSIPNSTTFDYVNKNFSDSEYYSNIKKQVDKFKDHPALLAWGVGNEVDKLVDGAVTEEAYEALNAVAEYIKTVDPYHPTTTVHAGDSPIKIQNVRKYSPCVDIVSVNIYVGISNTHSRVITSAQWQGPYMITEYSVNQPSEMTEETDTVFDGTVIEYTDSEKAQLYAERYTDHIYANKAECIGSFAFAAYDTYRGTHTWYNIFLEEDMKKTSTYDALYKVWTGSARNNTAPCVNSITIDGKTATDEIELTSGGRANIKIDVTDNDNDTLSFKYEIRKNDFNAITEPIDSVVFTANDDDLTEASVSRLPSDEGIYRLFVYAYDGNGNIGYGNVPFKIVEADESTAEYTHKIIAQESFSGITALGASYVTPTQNGFGGNWCTAKALTTASTMKITQLGGYNLATATPNQATTSIFNTLNSSINMASDSVYYGKWLQCFTGTNEANKFAKVGFADSGLSKVIECIFMQRTANTAPVLGLKVGSSVTYSDVAINHNELYNVLMKIDASSSGNDTVSVKIWPITLQEPLDWTYTVTSNLSDELSMVTFQTAVGSGKRAYFGEFSLEKYDKTEVTSQENLFASCINNGSAYECPYTYGIVYDSFTNMLKLKDGVYIKDIALYYGDTRRPTAVTDSEDSITVKVVLKNDSNQDMTYENTIYVAIYNDEGLEKILLEKPIEEIKAKESKVCTFCMAGEAENISYDKLKVFV